MKRRSLVDRRLVQVCNASAVALLVGLNGRVLFNANDDSNTQSICMGSMQKTAKRRTGH